MKIKTQKSTTTNLFFIQAILLIWGIAFSNHANAQVFCPNPPSWRSDACTYSINATASIGIGNKKLTDADSGWGKVGRLNLGGTDKRWQLRLLFR